MDSECKTPRIDEKTELFTPPMKNASSKGLLTPCRQVGLRRRSLKRITSPATTNTEITPTSSISSPMVATNESECASTPKRQHRTFDCKSIFDTNQKGRVNHECVKHDSKSELCNNEITINSYSNINDAQLEGSVSEISNFSAVAAKEESTDAVELIKPSTSNNKCEFSITPVLKKCYTPRCKRALTSYQNCQVVGEHNVVENKSDIDKTAHSSSHTKDIHWSSISKIPVANDFSHVIKTVPIFGEIKQGEDVSEKLIIMKQYVKEQEEQLRLLKLAHVYRKKHDPDKMSALINKWREICKAALYKLQEILASRGQPMTMAELLEQFRFRHDILKFNPETDDFD